MSSIRLQRRPILASVAIVTTFYKGSFFPSLLDDAPLRRKRRSAVRGAVKLRVGERQCDQPTVQFAHGGEHILQAHPNTLTTW